MIRFLQKKIQWISTDQILKNNLTLFTQSYDYSFLIQSVKEIGIANPLILKPLSREKSQIVCGHRRIYVAKELGLKVIPAWFISKNLSETELIRVNLIEDNKTYTDIECGNILAKLKGCKTTEKLIIKEYMPIIGLEKSKNLLDQYLKSASLDEGLQGILHDLKIPIRIYSICFSWKPNCQKSFKNTLIKLKPGVNKVRLLLDTIDEIGRREKITPEKILSDNQITKFLESGETAGIAFDKIQEQLFKRRFPELDQIKTNVILAKDKLKLSDKIVVKTSNSFESKKICLEIKFSTLEEIINYSNNLSEVAHSKEMKKFIKLFESID